MAKSNYHRGERGKECFFCEATADVEEHHIIPQRFDGPDNRDNIVDVCGDCHKKLESLYDSAFYRWFGIEDKSNNRRFHRACVVHSCSNTVDFEFVIPEDMRGRKTYLCKECSLEWFDRKWVNIFSSMCEDGVELFISQEGKETVRNMRKEDGYELNDATGEPIMESGIRRSELEELGWGRVGVTNGDNDITVVDGGEFPGMDKLEMLVEYSVSFSSRIGEELDQ